MPTTLYKREVRAMLARHECVQQIEGDWLIARATPSHAKLLVSALIAYDCPFFFPYLTMVRYYEKRKVVAQVPMLPGYLFVTEEARPLLTSELLKRHLVSRDDSRFTRGSTFIVVAAADRPRFVHDLANFQIMADATQLNPNSSANMIFHPLRQKGTRVVVEEGPYIGLHGEIVGYDGKEAKVQVSVILLGTAATVSIPEDFLSQI